MFKSKIGPRERIHFVGIGGIGMSGLAQVMKDMGFNVQGSDVANNKNVDRCKKIGIKFDKSMLKWHKGHHINDGIWWNVIYCYIDVSHR